jgi:glycosyltransferase involved in cell wall biosynthesis
MKILHYVESANLSFRVPYANLLRELGRRGMEQSLLCRPGGDLERAAIENGISVHSWKAPVAGVPMLNPWFPTLVKTIAPDIIHTRLSSAASMAGFWRRFVNIPVISMIDKASKNKYYRGADHYMACAGWIKDHMVGQGMEADKIDVVYNSIDAGFYRRNESERALFRQSRGISEGGKIFVGAGIFREEKGFDILIDAFGILLKSGIDAWLMLVGDGEMKKALAGQASSLGIGERLIFSDGFAPDIRPWLWGADCLVLPSRAEPFGLIVLEAIASGLPVIATSVGGPLEILTDGQNGLLTPPGDPSAMAEVMRRFAYMDEQDLETMNRNAQKRLGDFTCEAVASKITEIYARVVSGFG